MMKLPRILHACSTGCQKPVFGNFGTPKPIYVSRFYEQHVAKNAFLLEGRNCGMAWTQNQNYPKPSNNLNPVLKTLEHEGTHVDPCYYFELLLLCI